MGAVGLLVTEFRGTIDPTIRLGKLLGPNTQLQELRVNGRRGYWIEGQPHVLFFRDAAGAVRDERIQGAPTMNGDRKHGMFTESTRRPARSSRRLHALFTPP